MQITFRALLCGLMTLGAVVMTTASAQLVADAATAKARVLDARRSLAVTELEILQRFPFQRVLNQLVAQSGVPGLTSLGLFRQWWDTQNPAPGMLGGPYHCDERLDATGEPVLNGYPYTCRPAMARHEGSEATADPFASPQTSPAAYMPVGLFNRFDLAPADGRHCGEYRVAYARRSGATDATTRNFILFEAVMPNPMPQLGLRGCRRIAQFWASLSKEEDLGKRARRLEAFYFDGIDGMPPVIEPSHYGDNALGAGQVRTNQFMVDPAVKPRVWTLREYKLLRHCNAQGCSGLAFMPTTDKNNPFGPLFSSTADHPASAAFQARFRVSVESLAASTLDRIDMETDDTFNSGQSQASGSDESNYLLQLSPEPTTFRHDIEASLPAGSTLTAEDIVSRARAMSCAGCHRSNNNVPIGGGLVWPASLGFTHVSEKLEADASPARYQLSPALLQAFLPARQRVLQDFLDDKPFPTPRPHDPIGGRRVH